MLAMLCIQVPLRVFRGLRGRGFEPVGRDDLVVVVSRYGPYGSVIESGCPSAHPSSYIVGTGSVPLVKRPGRGVGHPPHLAPRLKKSRIIPLHLLWNFVACCRGNFAFLWS